VLRIGRAATISEQENLVAIAEAAGHGVGRLGNDFAVRAKKLGLNSDAFRNEPLNEFG
jgi:hypothetical protein